jgi:hypothetical protein
MASAFSWGSAMSQQGWVKIHRSVMGKGWLTNPKLWTFWSYCLLKASHKQTTTLVGNQQVFLEPGQFVFGRKRAATDLDMSEKNIRTFVETLVRMGNLRAIKRASKYTVFFVVNWVRYQGHNDENDRQEGREMGQQQGEITAGKGPQTRSEEVKNKENSAASPDVQAAIDYFCDTVKKEKGFQPRIGAKDRALAKNNLRGQSIENIKEQIDFFLQSEKSQKHISLAAALSTDSYNLFMLHQSTKNTDDPIERVKARMGL